MSIEENTMQKTEKKFVQKDGNLICEFKNKLTEEIFDAPWCMTIEGTEESSIPNCVASNHWNFVAQCATKDIAYKVQFLPQLYDCLLEATKGKCWSCSAANTEILLEKGCPKGKQEDECYVAKWLKILRLMRSGI